MCVLKVLSSIKHRTDTKQCSVEMNILASPLATRIRDRNILGGLDKHFGIP